MLHIILKEGATISFSGCIIQLFIFGASEMVECFLLTSMSYDRYLAICKPLHYSTIMNNQLQFHLLFISWFVGVTLTTGLVFQIYMFEFCSSNIIDHLYCDFTPVLDLSCSNTYILKLEDFIAAASITITSFTFIIVTYGSIFVTIIRSPSTTGRQKAFSTCSSHLLVVSAFYGTLITIYGVPSWAQSLNLNKSLSLLNTLLTPLFNPVIYSLRSKEIKGALKKLMIINALGAYPKHCQAMSWES
ncbi:olfactory receptor 6B1-like [Rhinophrynus dorsalis]